MRMFMFKMVDGKKATACGTSLADAIKTLREVPAWFNLNILREIGSIHEIPRSICGTSKCGCHYAAEERIPCEHDIAAWEKTLET